MLSTILTIISILAELYLAVMKRRGVQMRDAARELTTALQVADKRMRDREKAIDYIQRTYVVQEIDVRDPYEPRIIWDSGLRNARPDYPAVSNTAADQR